MNLQSSYIIILFLPFGRSAETNMECQIMYWENSKQAQMVLEPPYFGQCVFSLPKDFDKFVRNINVYLSKLTTLLPKSFLEV